MTTWLLPVAATLAAAALTYWCCVRPMRQGKPASAADTHGCCAPDSGTADLDAQIKQAAEELAQLRANAGSGRTP